MSRSPEPPSASKSPSETPEFLEPEVLVLSQGTHIHSIVADGITTVDTNLSPAPLHQPYSYCLLVRVIFRGLQACQAFSLLPDQSQLCP